MDLLLHLLTNDHGEWQMLLAMATDAWPAGAVGSAPDF